VSKKVLKIYNKLISSIGSELEILLNSTEEEISSASLPKIARGVVRARQHKIVIEPGYDGTYGKIKIF
jgi:DNA helicase-2/ATP-dependent DNA helicase PcrA